MAVDQETLKSLPLLEGLDTTELEEVASHLHIQEIGAGEELIREGDETAHALYFLLQGSVDVIKRGMDGRGHVISSLSAPSVFGEMEALTRRRAAAGVVTTTPVKIASLNRGAFNELCEQNRPCVLKVIRSLARVLSYRLAATDERLAAQFDLGAPGTQEIRRVIFSGWRAEA